MANPLVSVIIPCFNAQQWLSEAIDSVLTQTYPQIEIIVIDDGSTDGSLEIIKSYGEQIIWETGSNQGANRARNRGFALAQGEYIQYLDADDYLFPDKIAEQVRFLKASVADIVYADWRHQIHLADGSSYLDDVRVCGPKADFLESLLANDRWSNLTPILFSRSIVADCEGWDESLPAAQDRDFLISLALAEAKFAYQPRCDSIYRRPYLPTVSVACKLRWLNAHCSVMEKAERRLTELGKLSTRYQKALAQAYRSMGREYLYSDRSHPEIEKYRHYAAILNKIAYLYPQLFAEYHHNWYQLLSRFLGYRATEKISYLLRERNSSLTEKIKLLITSY